MKVIKLIIIFFLINASLAYSNEREFLIWKSEFKKHALSNDISEKTFDLVMNKVRFLPKVIEYDRFQPEFYEDTKTYINKRTSDKKVKKAKRIE